MLLVEDNDINQQVALELLRDAGVVASPRTAQEALEMLAAERFDLVLMDMQMPVMDGSRPRADPRAAGASACRSWR